MLDKLSLLLKSKIALAAVGATLVAGGGASVAAAATGAQVPVVSQALHAATGTHDANDDHGQDAAGHDANDDKGHDGAAQGTPAAGQHDANDNDANDDNGQDANDNDANEHEATGSVVSVDASGSSFVLKESGGASVTVTVSASTVFDGGLTKAGDLKAGMSVEVKGATQADGSVAASRVHGEDVNEDQGDDHGGSGSGSSGSGSGSSGGSGSGGGSDDHGGNG